jgi:thiol:disulfide interchange protein DsbC
MVREQPAAAATCDVTALNRNTEFGRKYKITGTPTLFFVDGTRVPGAADAAQVEKLLSGGKS